MDRLFWEQVREHYSEKKRKLYNKELLPPYTKEEMSIMMQKLKSRLSIPQDLYDYLTIVSRENLIFDDYHKIININRIYRYKKEYIPPKNLHKNGCKCFYKYIETIPIECDLMTEEERQIYNQEKEKFAKKYSDRQFMEGLNLGQNKGGGVHFKMIILQKNSSLFGQIFKQEDDSSYGSYFFIKYANSFKDLIRVKMQKEKMEQDTSSDVYSGDLYEYEKRV